MPLDKQTFAIIIIITTIASYFLIRKLFKIAPRFLGYAVVGILVGLIAGIAVAWPMSKFLGEFGIIVAPYVLGIILMMFIEFFIIEGRNVFQILAERYRR